MSADFAIVGSLPGRGRNCMTVSNKKRYQKDIAFLLNGIDSLCQSGFLVCSIVFMLETFGNSFIKF